MVSLFSLFIFLFLFVLLFVSLQQVSKICLHFWRQLFEFCLEVTAIDRKRDRRRDEGLPVILKSQLAMKGNADVTADLELLHLGRLPELSRLQDWLAAYLRVVVYTKSLE